jgi:ethanolamine ammonia-lyase large subunit
MGIPGSDDIMLNYQSTSFHDALAMRQLLGLKPAPEFEAWLRRMGISEAGEGLRLKPALPDALAAVVQRLETS